MSEDQFREQCKNCLNFFWSEEDMKLHSLCEKREICGEKFNETSGHVCTQPTGHVLDHCNKHGSWRKTT